MTNTISIHSAQLLKIIEEPPNKTYILIVSSSLPDVYENRIGFVHNICNRTVNIPQIVRQGLEIIVTGYNDEIEAISAIANLLIKQIKTYSSNHKIKVSIDLIYDLLTRVLEVYEYVVNERISSADGLSICIELMNLNCIADFI